MCSVAVGRSFNTYEKGLPDHLCPPPGYDSVVGEVSCLFEGIIGGKVSKQRRSAAVHRTPKCLVRQSVIQAVLVYSAGQSVCMRKSLLADICSHRQAG